MKLIKIALLGTQHDYADGLFPLIVRQLGFEIEWCTPNNCDLVIYGAFLKANQKHYRWLPKPLRPFFQAAEKEIKARRSYRPLSLFHTCESLRHNAIKADYSISFDLGINQKKNLRLPYWMELIDWSHEGIIDNINPRFGELLSLEKLTKPLGDHFLRRPQIASFITSHLLEPRASLLNMLKNHMEVKCFGPYFDPTIKNHHASSFIKKEVMSQFAFNLCPENAMYPGYYTEKIPEAFLAGALPITWSDSNVSHDFNPEAFINLAPMTGDNFLALPDLLNSKTRLQQFSEQSLLLEKPTLTDAKKFILEIILQATS
jgi:alpha(1,3/1,4) fucosyltransferase